jgi:hypothetical protein
LGVICLVLLSCGGERRVSGMCCTRRQQDLSNGVVWI